MMKIMLYVLFSVINSSVSSVILTFAESKDQQLAIVAKNILNFVKEARYIDHPIIPDENGRKKEKMFRQVKLNAENEIRITPNPTKDFAELQYNFTEGGLLKLSVYNIANNLVYEEDFEGRLGVKMINTAGWNSGVYLVRLTSEIGISYATKLTVVK